MTPRSLRGRGAGTRIPGQRAVALLMVMLLIFAMAVIVTPVPVRSS